MKIAQADDLKEFPLFEGVSGKIVFSSDKVMFLIVKIPPRGEVPEHFHRHEQMGICLQGKALFKSEHNTKIVEKGMFYWIFSFTVSPSGIIYLIEDFSLSSTFQSNNLFRFADNKWEEIDTDGIPGISFFTPVKADKRNYCWVAGNMDNSAILHVNTGEVWESSPEGIFPDDFITTIETDNDNNIWVGTYNNGVFILNQ